MPLDRDAVRRAIDLLKQSSAAELEIAEADRSVRVMRSVAAPAADAPPAPEAEEEAVPVVEAVEEGVAEPGEPPEHRFIEARMVGLFHRGRGPEGEPLVKVGDRVTQGQPVATIEALRKLTEVRSPVDGEVDEVLVEDGQPVQYGQKLFAVNVAAEQD